MKPVTRDIDNILSLKEKEYILKDLHQEDLISLFKKGFKPQYKKIEPKKTALDQQIGITIDKDEKELISLELSEIRKAGSRTSLSSFLRNRATSNVDIGEWNAQAVEGLKQLASDDWNPKKIQAKRRKIIKALDDLQDNDSLENVQDEIEQYEDELKEYNERLDSLKKQNRKRGYKVSARVTYSEANTIRWRAARLSLSVADYMRFAIFGYLPFTEADNNLTLEARKRFYVSVIDVYKNGWGEAPTVNECPNCARHIHEIEILKEQVKRYKLLITQSN